MASKNRQGCCCTGKRCLILQDFCVPHDPIEGADVKVYEHGTDNLLYDLTTKKDGKVCWDDVPGVTKYDVTVTAEGYDELKINGNDESFAPTPTYVMKQHGTGGVTFLVRGCSFQPLPDAVVTLDGKEYITDSTGHVHIVPPDGGIYPYTVTHPSGRFGPRSGNATVNGPCAVSTEVTVGLPTATGYRCCPVNKDGVISPYPNSTTLFITTTGGTDQFTAITCFVTLNLVKSSPFVAGDPPSEACPPPAGSHLLPPDLGTGDIPITYVIDIDGSLSGGPPGVPVVTEYMRESSLSYGPCNAPNTAQIRWRRSGPGAYPSNTFARGSIAVTVNSLAPALSFTVTIGAVGNGYGPVGLPSPPLTGHPYSPTLTISE